MKRIAIFTCGYYPHPAPIGLVFDKIRPFVSKDVDIEVFHIRRSREEPQTIDYERVKVHAVSNWLNDWRHCTGKLASIKRHVARLAYLFCYAWRLQNGEENLAAAFVCKLESEYRRKPFDALVSFSFPLFMHQAAKIFKRRHPSIRWVTYSADTTFCNPHLDSCIPFRFLRPLYIKQMNRKEVLMYESADYNLVTPEIYHTLASQPMGLPKDCAIFEYPFFNADKIVPDDQYFQDRRALHFVYAGGVGELIRSPRYFIDIIEHLPPSCPIIWHLFITGNASASLNDAASRNPSRFVMHRPLPYDKMQRVFMAADGLVNLGNNSDAFSPSKLYDYVSTGKPIVNLYYRGRFKSSILDDYPYLLEIENFSNVQADVKRLVSFCAGIRGRRMCYNNIVQLHPHHAAESVASRFVEVIGNEDD